MPFNDQQLLQLLQACADAEPGPLYPARHAKEANLDRGALDRDLDELRRRGLIKLSEWVRDLGQGCALTDAGRQSLASKRLIAQPPPPSEFARTPVPTLYDRGEIVRDALYYPSTPIVGRILLGINIAYFLFGALYAGYEELAVRDYLTGDGPAANKVVYKLGGLYSPRITKSELFPTARPQIERIVLYSFLHFGLLHLGLNMYFLYSLGGMIESMWGRWRFLAIYLIAGIVSGCVALLIEFAQHAEPGLMAGASGSMFGLFAALVVWFGLNYQHLPGQVIDAFKRNLGINLILLVGINFVPGVSWQGHLGGAIGGALAALLLHIQRFHPSAPVRALALLALPFVPIGFFTAVLWMAGWM